MKKFALVVAAGMAIWLGHPIGVQAGPVSPDNGGINMPGQTSPRPPPALAGPNITGGGDVGEPGQSPSFGGQAPEGAGLSAPAPGSLPGADDPSGIINDAGDKH